MLEVTENQPPESASAPQQGPAAATEVHPDDLKQSASGAVDLASGEYQALRAEIVARIQKQQDIMNFAILVITALLTYAGFQKISSSTLSHTVAALGAPASLALSIFALMTLDHEMNIAHATRYIYGHLRTVWKDLAGTKDEDDILQWNVARATWQQPSGLSLVLPSTMAAAKYYAITLLNLLLVIVSWVEFTFHASQFTSISLVLLGLATALLALAISASIYISRIWLRMKKDPNKFPLRP